jgi:hypothetical protein
MVTAAFVIASIKYIYILAELDQARATSHALVRERARRYSQPVNALAKGGTLADRVVGRSDVQVGLLRIDWLLSRVLTRCS